METNQTGAMAGKGTSQNGETPAKVKRYIVSIIEDYRENKDDHVNWEYYHFDSKEDAEVFYNEEVKKEYDEKGLFCRVELIEVTIPEDELEYYEGDNYWKFKVEDIKSAYKKSKKIGEGKVIVTIHKLFEEVTDVRYSEDEDTYENLCHGKSHYEDYIFDTKKEAIEEFGSVIEKFI